MLKQALASMGRLFGLGQPMPPRDNDRRVWGRASCDVETTCQRAGDPNAPWLTARVRNISQGGIGLTVPQPFSLGALLSVTLPGRPGTDEPTEVLACVVRCDPAEQAGRFDLGCTFAGTLSDDDLARFGAHRACGGPDDKRQFVRYACHAGAAYQIVRPPAPTPLAAAKVLDISASGIALEVSELLHVGDLLSLDLSRDGEVVLTTLASVTRTATGHDGKHLIGCNFIRELSEDVVTRLV
jgi:hypothetical protein